MHTDPDGKATGGMAFWSRRRLDSVRHRPERTPSCVGCARLAASIGAAAYRYAGCTPDCVRRRLDSLLRARPAGEPRVLADAGFRRRGATTG